MAVQQISVTLLSAASATGASTPVEVPGEYMLTVNGSFGGCTFGIEKLGPDGTNWIGLKDAAGLIALTSADALVLALPAGSYRGKITGGSAVSLSARLELVG